MADPDKMQSFVAQPIRFEPFCFQGEKFPACDFDKPDAVRELIGPYTIKAAFYDCDGRPAQSAKAPGRYAAVVEIHHSGKISKRFVTLCRMGGAVDEAVVASEPAALLAAGIDARVIEACKAELLVPREDHFLPVRPTGITAATLAAGLYDLTALMRAGKAAPPDSLSQLDRQWWVRFKRRYYGYDKVYPKEFICPRPVGGKGAPTIRQGTLAQAGMKADAIETIDRACESWAADALVGFGLCVVRHGVLVCDKAYGKQKDGAAFTTTTPAQLASATKFLSATLLSEFADQGLIGIDDPADKYVAALRGISVPRVPTVRELYLHLAGFTGHWSDTLNDIEERVADLYPTLDVGVRHRYQGVGIALAGKIMEMISGESIPRLFSRHLMGPLDCKIQPEMTSYGTFGTAGELVRIGQMMLNGGAYGDMRFTGPEVIRQMMPIAGADRFDPDRSIRWGVGSKLFDSDGLSEQAFGHSGACGSFLKIDPTYDMVIAMARNEEGKDFLKRRAGMIKAILDGVDGRQ
jgi:CubicO group peptidase (beta-lactamase class C family)